MKRIILKNLTDEEQKQVFKYTYENNMHTESFCEDGVSVVEISICNSEDIVNLFKLCQ